MRTETFKERLERLDEQGLKPLELLCRRHNFSTMINQRAYCTKTETCIYRDINLDSKVNKYRCMNLEKMYTYRDQEDYDLAVLFIAALIIAVLFFIFMLKVC